MATNQNPQQRVMPTMRMTDYAKSKQFTSTVSVFRLIGNTCSSLASRCAQVSRDGMAFFLTEHTGECSVGGLVHLYVPDVDQWFAECQRKGIRVQEPPNECLPWLRSMTVADPDGNKLHNLHAASRLASLASNSE